MKPAINRDDLRQGPGGIDNFLEAAKAIKGEPHGAHTRIRDTCSRTPGCTRPSRR